MKELLMLRQYIQEQNYEKALELIGDMEEMSKEDKLNKIYSYAVI
jgi:pentatricopeptide repeat protein